MAGPDPDLNRARANEPKKEQGRVILPPGGRVGNPPKPRTGQPVSDAGRQFWRDLWSTPQAVMWGKAQVHVATRLLLAWEEQEESGFSNARSSEMRQLEHSLGLTDKSMKELGWSIEEPESDDEVEIPDEYAHLRVVNDAS